MPFTNKNWAGMITLLLVMVIGFGHQSLVEAGELNISLKPIFPENQVDKSLSYYELRVKPGEKQTIEVEATNHADHEVTLLSYATTAITGTNGTINYQEIKAAKNATLDYPFAEIAHIAEKTVIGPLATKRIPIEIDVPDQAFPGYILGGLYFKEENSKDQDKGADSDQKDEEKDGGGFQIENVFSYVMTVSLSENEEIVQPDLELLDARAGQQNYQNVLEGNLQNPTPDILEDLSIVAKVYKKGSNTFLYKKESVNVRMAPNSNFYYGVPTKKLVNGEEKNMAIEAGTYEFEVAATNGEQSWQLKKEFVVTKEEANKLNQEALDELEYPINWKLWIGIGVGVFVVLLILVIWITLAISKKNNRKRTSSKKSKSGKKSSSGKKNGR